MPIETVLFDCDGTLVDSETLTIEVLVEFAREHGVAIDYHEALSRHSGGKMADVVRDLEARREAPLPESFVPEFRRRQAETFRERLKPIDGAADLLEAIELPCAVVSSGPREKIELTLSLTGLRRFFDDRIFSSYEVGSWKPEPDVFLHAAERQGVAPAHCVVVEDSWPGIRAGLSAGMQVFAFRPPGHPPIAEALPTEVVRIERLAELTAHLAE